MKNSNQLFEGSVFSELSKLKVVNLLKKSLDNQFEYING